MAAQHRLLKSLLLIVGLSLIIGISGTVKKEQARKGSIPVYDIRAEKVAFSPEDALWAVSTDSGNMNGKMWRFENMIQVMY